MTHHKFLPIVNEQWTLIKFVPEERPWWWWYDERLSPDQFLGMHWIVCPELKQGAYLRTIRYVESACSIHHHSHNILSVRFQHQIRLRLVVKAPSLWGGEQRLRITGLCRRPPHSNYPLEKSLVWKTAFGRRWLPEYKIKFCKKIWWPCNGGTDGSPSRTMVQYRFYCDFRRSCTPPCKNSKIL